VTSQSSTGWPPRELTGDHATADAATEARTLGRVAGMAMLKKNGKPKKKALPSTVARSGKKARRTFAKAHDSAAKQYGGGEQAMRTAWAALEQTHELVGKRWRKKPAGGGLDSSATKKHLYNVARDLQIEGRSTMSKAQLIDAITAENERRSTEGGS